MLFCLYTGQLKEVRRYQEAAVILEQYVVVNKGFTWDYCYCMHTYYTFIENLHWNVLRTVEEFLKNQFVVSLILNRFLFLIKTDACHQNESCCFYYRWW